MVTVYKEKIIPRRIIKVESHVECDLCGKEGTYGWEDSNYEVADSIVSVEVRCKEGDAYPDIGDGIEWKYDICPKCFKEKLIPWFESQGVDREKKWEY